MDLIFERKLPELDRALSTLEEAIAKTDLEPLIRRDLMVCRFLYTSELFGKTIQNYLREVHKMEVKFIGDGYRKARAGGLLFPEEVEFALEMQGDRNFCAHAYQESVVEKISVKIPKYAEFMREVYRKLESES